MTIEELRKFIKISQAIRIEVAQCENCGEYVIAICPGINAFLSIIDGAYKDSKIVCGKCGGNLKFKFLKLKRRRAC